jgi:hypothetical protein
MAKLENEKRTIFVHDDHFYSTRNIITLDDLVEINKYYEANGNLRKCSPVRRSVHV